MAEDIEELRARFLKEIPSVPLPIRDEIIAVVDGQPFTWASAYLEISQKTETGNKLLEVLKVLKII